MTQKNKFELSFLNFFVSLVIFINMLATTAGFVADDFAILEVSLPTNEQVLQHGQGVAKVVKMPQVNGVSNIELYIKTEKNLKQYECIVGNCGLELASLHDKKVEFSWYQSDEKSYHEQPRILLALTIDNQQVFTYQQKIQQVQEQQSQAKIRLIIWLLLSIGVSVMVCFWVFKFQLYW